MFSPSLRRSLLARPAFAAARRTTRPISQSARLAAHKDAQDKDSMKIEPNENTKSGSDPGAAAVEDAAFSRDKTRPEQQHAAAEKESGKDGNPLDVSPANQDVSKARDPQEGGSEGSASQAGEDERARTSGGSGSGKHKADSGKRFQDGGRS
ncbi:hypothetical protein B0A48_05426 [Cryoendolithus antarcticus]|uniref:Uncharacterized protein n=1 Tax=Cryoendolithus antarcticus TaxID=1507870 RepID=A0A1V8TIH9_9PEZI|nr:hypothetical protein B0A48_05426 [Cryoendolithus antarcticus]